MTTTPFSVRLAPETKQKLEKWAERHDRPVSYLVQNAIDDYLENLEQLQREMAAAEADLAKGEFVSEEAMNTWIEAWSPTNRLPPPEADVFIKKKSAA